MRIIALNLSDTAEAPGGVGAQELGRGLRMLVYFKEKSMFSIKLLLSAYLCASLNINLEV